MLRTHYSSTGPVILVFNYHINFLSVTGRDLLNESNTFTLNPKPVALWHLFELKPFSSPHAACAIQNEAEQQSVYPLSACIVCSIDTFTCVRTKTN